MPFNSPRKVHTKKLNLPLFLKLDTFENLTLK